MSAIGSALFWLTLNLYHEARGQPTIAQLSVCHVTINRSKERNQTIKEAVTHPYQFSWRLERKKRKAKPWLQEPEAFLNCSIIAIQASTGPDITGGATYFHEARMKPKPRWTKKLKRVARYGDLIFYKEKPKV